MPILSNFPSGISDSVQQQIEAKQSKITVSGLLKGDGSGKVVAAEAGVDYVESPEVFYAVFDETNFADIASEYSAGRLCVCVKDGTTYYLNHITTSSCSFSSLLDMQQNYYDDGSQYAASVGGGIMLNCTKLTDGRTSWSSFESGVAATTTVNAALKKIAAKINSESISAGYGLTEELIGDGGESGKKLHAYYCNPNLLANWYFPKPVNQRGETTYTGLGYGIDRWKAESSTPNVVTIEDGYIGLSQNALISQLLDEPYGLCGKQVTVSALTTTGLYSATAAVPSKEDLSAVTADKTIGVSYFVADGNNTGYVCIQHSKNHATRVILRAYTGYTVNVIAVKLELGNVQTLAHQDTDGNWVLNEISNYNTELLKCQRYFQVIASPYESTGNGVAIGYANNTVDLWVDFNLPIPMRTSPVVSIPDITLFKLGKTSGSQKDITKATGGWATRNNDSCNMRSIIFTSSGLMAGENYVLFMKNGAKMTLSAEL